MSDSSTRWLARGGAVLLVAAAGALLVETEVRRCQREAEAVALLQKFYGEKHVQIQYGWRFAEGGYVDPRWFEPPPSWLSEQLGVDIFRTVRMVRISAPGNSFSYRRSPQGQLRINQTYKTGLRDEHAVILGRFHYLEQLSLEANPISDAGIARLTNLTQLKYLHLGNTAITDGSLDTLKLFEQLEVLDVGRTLVSDQLAKTIRKMPDLIELNVTMTNVSTSATGEIERFLPNCEVMTDH